MSDQQAEDNMVGPPRSSRPLPVEPYGWHGDADVRKEQAIKGIKDAWRAYKSGGMTYDLCYQTLRDPLLWHLSNCECLAIGSTSSNTDFRFMTDAAYDLCDPAGKNDHVGLQQEHVYQRKEMAIEILKCATEEAVEKTIARAAACIVTKAEHRNLDNFKHLYGWERYHAAGLKVIERQRTERPGRRPRRNT
jgi:hypothetical protein